MDSSIPVANLENETTINDLPDSVLCKILSLLPTKNAVSTSVLSTRWKRLFPFFWIPPISLELDDSLFLNPIGNESVYPSRSFIDFVDNLFGETLSQVSQVETIILHCRKLYHDDDDEKPLSWINAALRLKVRHLVLDFAFVGDPDEPLLDRLNGCSTLVRLVLFLRTELILPDDFTLPNLKVLTLGGLRFDDDDGERKSINKLIQGCPALSKLCFVDCSLYLSGDLVIRSPMLNSLVIIGGDSGSYNLNLDAPNLSCLILMSYRPRSYRLTSFNALTDAHIDVVGSNELQFDEEGCAGSDYQDENDTSYVDKGVGSIVTACASTTCLTLGASAIYALRHSAVELPTFQNLSWLALGCLEYDGWRVLARLLHSAPNLQELTFREEFKSNDGYLSFRVFVQSPPICLQSQIKKIRFCVFKGEKDEMKLLKFFLLNGEVLEKAILHCLPSIALEVLNSLDKLPGHEKIVLKHDSE